MPSKIPSPLRIFHITGIPNLDSIFAEGSLEAKNRLASKGVGYSNIAYQTVQNIRAQKPIRVGPGGMMHDYVPFYFAPRSPMLYAINQGAVAGCSLRQEDVVHFETTVENILANGSNFVFFDMNAAIGLSKCFDSLIDLDKIAWDLITEEPTLDGFCRYFHSKHSPPRYATRMEQRQAEFMVHQSVSLSCITRIGVFDDNRKIAVENFLRQHSLHMLVEVKKQDWYF
jgi:hypothetical protein